MAARRLWYSIASLAAFLAIFAVARADERGQRSDGVRVDEGRLLTDFLILAIQPDGDERDYRMVEVGRTKVDAGPLSVVVNALPFDFFGLRKPERDEAAELAQCWAACRKRAICRDVVYERAGAGRPVGVCRLQTYAVKDFGVMAPVVEPGDERASRIPPKHEPRRPVLDAAAEAPALTAPPEATRPPPKRPERPREVIPPPPRLPPATVEYFPMPPRVVAEAAVPPVATAPLGPAAPPVEAPPPIEAAEPSAVEEPFVPEPEAPARVASGPPTSILIPQPPADAAETSAPAERKRGLPLWLALGAVVAVVGGAALYWRNHRLRMLGRLNTRLVSDGLAGQTVRVVGAEHRGLDLRFVVSASAAVGAPGTHIELVPKGAAA